MVLTLVTLFIIYEVTKLLLPESYIRTYHEMNEIQAKFDFKADDVNEQFKSWLFSRYTVLLVVEILYLIFVAALLFTSYWIVGALLIVLAIVFKKRLTPKRFVIDSVLSIIVLSLAFVL